MEQDLKEEPTTPTIDPVEKEEVKEEEPQAEAEEPKKEELPDWATEKIQKLEEEKENYKKGMLKYKKHTLEPEKEEEETEEDYPDWDETSKKFQAQTLSQAEKVAERKVSEVIGKANEQSAISQFLESHPEAEGKWDDIVSNINLKEGKSSVGVILKALNKAYTLTRIEAGEFDKVDNKEAKSKLADMSSVTKTTSKVATKGSNALSPGALNLADKMRVDPKKLAEEDDSSTATAKF